MHYVLALLWIRAVSGESSDSYEPVTSVTSSTKSLPSMVLQDLPQSYDNDGGYAYPVPQQPNVDVDPNNYYPQLPIAPYPQPLPQPIPHPPIIKEIKVPVLVPQPYPVRVVQRVPVPVPRPYPVAQKIPVRVPVYIKVPQPVRVPIPVPVKVPVYIRVPVSTGVDGIPGGTNVIGGGFGPNYEPGLPGGFIGDSSSGSLILGRQPAPVYGPPNFPL